MPACLVVVMYAQKSTKERCWGHLTAASSQQRSQAAHGLACFCCSVERMVGYIKEYEPEAPAVVESHRPPSSWPSEGDISVQKLVVRYRSDLPEVLKGLTFHVHARHKVCALSSAQP